MNDKPVRELLAAVLAGNAAAVDELRSIPQEELRRAADRLGTSLQIGRLEVLRVLREWRSGMVTDQQVRYWALFLFLGGFPHIWTPYGYVASFNKAGQPLNIEYADDELVNEVVFRLKDLGDAIDGTISEEDRDRMIDALSAGLT